MKTLAILSTVFIQIFVTGGEFVNLDFDSPRLDRLRPGETIPRFGPAEDLLRGWEVSLRPALQDWQPYSGEVELTFQQAIFTPVALTTGYGLGNYGVWFHEPNPPIGTPGEGPPLPAPEIRLTTTGTVPANAFAFDWLGYSATRVSITDGQNLAEAEGAQRSLDVRQFAGKEVTISVIGIYGFDVVGFKTVPEPQTWALLGVGLGAVVWVARKR